MRRLNVVLLSTLVALLSVRSVLASRPGLTYSTKDGRIFVTGVHNPTVSVLWDMTAQDIVASLNTGPTVAAGAYAMMHTAIFEAWSSYRSRHTTPAQKAAMNYAAFFVLEGTFKSRKNVAQSRLNRSLQRLTLGRFALKRAESIGRIKAKRVLSRYNRLVLGTIREYPFRSAIEKWTPERVPIDNPRAKKQKFLTPEWGRRYTFGVPNGAYFTPSRPEPFLLVRGTMNMRTKTIKLDNGRVLRVSRSLIGTVINPKFIRQAEQVVQTSASLSDRSKIIAEFWEAGAKSSFPPGIWCTFGQWVSARDAHSEEDDVRMFYALSNALSDAGILTWYAKRRYNYARPVRAIRDLAELRLIGRFDAILGKQVIRAYDLTTRRVRVFPAERFQTYQRPEVGASPPFPEYTSGHSGFSAAGAEVLRRWTGSDRFGAQVTVQVGESRFEVGQTPTRPVTLRWDTFTAASEQAGMSRIYGGIHFYQGNVRGLMLGRSAGAAAYKKATRR